MEYIYDIVLNFQDEYYDFYEWLANDKIVNIKKIPIYKISNQDYLNIKYNEITIDRNTLPKKNNIFLLTSGLEVIGILIDRLGKIIKKSSLLFEENDDILTNKDKIKLVNIKYIINKINSVEYIPRIVKEKNTYIINYLTKLDKQKDEYILKYLYYDLFDIEENDINLIYNKLISLTKENNSKIYDSIKKINI